jgi:hypothetical protein
MQYFMQFRSDIAQVIDQDEKARWVHKGHHVVFTGLLEIYWYSEGRVGNSERSEINEN